MASFLVRKTTLAYLYVKYILLSRRNLAKNDRFTFLVYDIRLNQNSLYAWGNLQMNDYCNEVQS